MPRRSRIAVRLALALVCTAAPGAGAQTLDATLASRQQALPKQKTAYQETILQASKGGAASEKDLKLTAKVAVYQEAPQERIEIQPVEGSGFGEPVVIVSNGKGYFLVTKVGSTPLAKSPKAQDPVVLQELSSMPNATGKKRSLKGSDGKLAAVIYREPRPADFSSSTAFSMQAPKLGGGLLKKGLSSFAGDDQPVVTASAGARGVDQIQTPNGAVNVTPDSSAVVWMEKREVSPLDLESFLLTGGLGPYAGEEAAQ
jgi:hypothetical protein